jgi:hypothetical protein
LTRTRSENTTRSRVGEASTSSLVAAAQRASSAAPARRDGRDERLAGTTAV